MCRKRITDFLGKRRATKHLRNGRCSESDQSISDVTHQSFHALHPRDFIRAARPLLECRVGDGPNWLTSEVRTSMKAGTVRR